MIHRTGLAAIRPLILTWSIMTLATGLSFLLPRFDQTAFAGSGSTFPPPVQRPPDIAVERLDRPPRDRPGIGQVIDLNTASLDQLATLPGIDEPTARSIIAGRPYRTGDELVEKQILSEAEYEMVKDRVTVRPE